MYPHFCALPHVFISVSPTEPPVTGYCATGQFMCISDRRCVPHSSICNGIPECKDGSDERNCGKSTAPYSRIRDAAPALRDARFFSSAEQQRDSSELDLNLKFHLGYSRTGTEHWGAFTLGHSRKWAIIGNFFLNKLRDTRIRNLACLPYKYRGILTIIVASICRTIRVTLTFRWTRCTCPNFF